MSEIFFADVNGIKLAYKIEGEGHPIVLIHGYNNTSFFTGYSVNLVIRDTRKACVPYTGNIMSQTL